MTFSPSTKRRREPEDDFPKFDLENIDPSLLSPSKKAKGGAGTPIKPAKPQQFVLKANGTTVTKPSAPSGTRAILTPKRPGLAVTAKSVSSAPSALTSRKNDPLKKRHDGLSSRRRVSASPSTRVDPPTVGTSSNGLPFSIDAAILGTTSSPKHAAKAKLSIEPPLHAHGAVEAEDMPKTWMFEIHEDTPDEELGNLMEFSTQTLDLSSDEESKVQEREERGKENVPPEGMLATAMTMAGSRKDAMTDEPRTPLGDLDAKDFYGEGCDSNSYIVVPGDKDEVAETKADANTYFDFNGMARAEPEEVRTPCPVDGTGESQDAWKSLLAQVEANQLPTPTADGPSDAGAGGHVASIVEGGSHENGSGSPEPIDIWESESAKDESEKPEEIVTVTQTLEESLAAAQAKLEAPMDPAAHVEGIVLAL